MAVSIDGRIATKLAGADADFAPALARIRQRLAALR
jgi:hypothetical protein